MTERSALICERRSYAVGHEEGHLYSIKKVITNRRTKTKIVLFLCAYCGRKAKP